MKFDHNYLLPGPNDGDILKVMGSKVKVTDNFKGEGILTEGSPSKTICFSVAGPTVWNSLPDCLRDPAVDSEQFRRDLKTYLFAGHSRR